MSSRTRRSTGNLNPATIHLLPIARLKEELQTRGLDLSGNKEELAYRLDEHLQLVGGAYKPFDPSPIIDEQNDANKKGGRGRKRKIDISTPFEHTTEPDAAERENIAESAAQQLLVKQQQQQQKPIIKFTWATEKPTAEHVPLIKLTTTAPPPQKQKTTEQLREEISVAELRITEIDEESIIEEKTPKKKGNEHKKKKKKTTTTFDEFTKVLVGTSENNKTADSTQSSIIDQESIAAMKEAKRKRKEEKRRRREEREKAEEQKEFDLAGNKTKNLDKKLTTTPNALIEQRSKGEASLKLNIRKNVPSDFPTNKFGEQQHKIIKTKLGTIEKRRITFAGGEETKLKQTKQHQGIMATNSTALNTSSSSKVKPQQQHTIKTAAPISSRLDILDSILDEQEQLLARKKAQKVAEGIAEDEEEKLINFELERREKRRFTGFTATPTTTILTTPTAQNIVKEQQHSSSRRMSSSGGGGLQQQQTTPIIDHAKTAAPIPMRPMNTSSSNYKLLPPPPPPPKRGVISPTNAAMQQQIQRDEDKQFPTSSSFSLPLIVDTRDPLGLSSVGPDTPAPPSPPPPPPSSTRPIKIPPPIQSNASFPISMGILPPPPPPPPRKALLVQQQKAAAAQSRQQEEMLQFVVQNKVATIESMESIVDTAAAVLSDLTENVSQMILEEEKAQNYEEQFENASPIFQSNDQGEINVNLMNKQITNEMEINDESEKSSSSTTSDLDAGDEDDEAEEEDSSTITDEEMSSNEQGEEYFDEEDEETEEKNAKEDNDNETPAELRHLLKDPKALLHKASDVLRKKFGGANSSELEPHAHYEQVALSQEEMKDEEDEEYRQLPDPDQFHGEPIPDDMDDDLFEIAAGLPLREKKRDKEPQPIEEEPLPNEEQIELDFYNSDLNMKSATNNKWLIEPDNADGFALMWGGVRSNYGLVVPEQRDDMPPMAYQVKIAELLSLKHLPFDEPDAHDIRIGWSRAGTSLMLGESPNSFAFNSMANKATGNQFTDYGEPFGLDDVITTVLDINCGEIRYFKNGQALGPAFTDIQFQTGDVYFPHMATKNCKLFVNFGIELPEIIPAKPASSSSGAVSSSNQQQAANNEEQNNNNLQWSMPMDEVPEGTKWIGAMDVRLMLPSRKPISDKAHCTIIAMVGLSGVGKTTWVRQYLKEHPEENWLLLNTDTILQAMAVNGVPRQRVHQGRWDMVMGLTAKALGRSLQMACRRRHNYILDQTNVTREARKRKLTQFQDFQRKCVVLIPSEAEHERRLIRQAREQGAMGQMPAEAMLEMKGNFSIPSTELEPIEDVIFIEPPIERINEAIEQVRHYNEEGQPWVRQQQQRHGRHRGPPAPVISDHSNLPFVGTTRICV